MDTPIKPTDDLISRYKKLKFPSGDIDDLIFGKVELKKSEGKPSVNPEVQK